MHEHAMSVLGGLGGHVTDVGQIGERPSCLACGQSCPMHGVWKWLVKPCEKEAPAFCRQALASLDAMTAHTQQQLRATASVLADL